MLTDVVPLSRVLLCVDHDTDRELLTSTLGAAYASMTAESPNANTVEPFRLLDVRDERVSVSECALVIAGSAVPPATTAVALA